MRMKELNNIQLESDRRCSVSELRKLLYHTPIQIAKSRGAKLKARVGLGNIVYIEATEGYIEDVVLGKRIVQDDRRTDNKCLVFDYAGRKYDIKFR